MAKDTQLIAGNALFLVRSLRVIIFNDNHISFDQWASFNLTLFFCTFQVLLIFVLSGSACFSSAAQEKVLRVNRIVICGLFGADE